MHENGFMTPENVYVHAATLTTDSYHRIAATGGSVSVSTESEQSAGQGYPPTWQVRRHDIPVSLSMDTSVWWSGDLFSAMRTTLGADRSREHLEAHAKGDTVTHTPPARRAGRRLGHPRRRARRSAATTSAASQPGKKADVVLIKNDDSPVSFPLLNPYGHVAFQAQRGDVHTVLVDGRVVKHDAPPGRRRPRRGPRARSSATVDHLRSTLGEEAWAQGMNPEMPATTRCSTTRTSTPSTSPSRHAAPGAASSATGSGWSRAVAGRGAGRTSSRRWRAGSTSSPASTPSIRPMTLSEVAAAAGLARPTARRLLLTLEELGYVRPPAGRSR